MRRPLVPGTQVTLFAVELPDLASKMGDLCAGFPIPVELNGEDIARPHAVAALATIATAIGHVFLAGADNGKSSYATIGYLQGLPVLVPECYATGDVVNVVHLDPRRFTARLPDRRTLIDAPEQAKLIEAVLKGLWREILLERKALLPAATFLDRYFQAAMSWGHLDLLDDIPLLPRGLCRQITGYPCQEGFGDEDYLQKVNRQISRTEIEQGEVVVVELDSLSDENLAHWMVAKRRGYLVMSNLLGENHWVNAHIRYLQEEDARIEVVGEVCRSHFEGRCISVAIVLCAKYVIVIGSERVEVADEAIYDGDRLIVPAGEQSGRGCGQVCDYSDELGCFQGDDLEADIDALADLIRLLRAADPEALLLSLIAASHPERYPCLAGKTFRLTVGASALEHTTALV